LLNTHPQNRHLVGDFAYVLDSFYLHTNSSDQYVSYCCRNYGIWEEDFTQWLISNIQEGWKCLDIGFNIGYHAEVLSRLVGKSGKVWAFEPNLELIEKYKEARKLNNYENCADIVMLPIALSNEDAELNLCIPSRNIGNASIVSQEEDRPFGSASDDTFTFQKVQAKRLDSFFNEPVDFIKIDIEGHEPQAWEGFPEIVKNCPLIVAELGPYHPVEFLQWIKDTYHMSLLNGQETSPEQILSHPHHLNVVLRKI